MELWLDSIDLKLVSRASKMGILHGVTTNPAILSETQQMEATIQSLLELQQGPITIQLTATDSEEMVHQGVALFQISDKIIVKIPVTEQGLRAIHILSNKGFETMATVIYSSHQYLLAAQAGAAYAAPYYSSMEQVNIDAAREIAKMCKLKQRYEFQTKLLIASLHKMEQVDTCIDLGCDAITLKEPLFTKFIEDNPYTLKRTEDFLKIWSDRQEPLENNTES